MQISDFQDATAYVMAKTGCTQYEAEDVLLDETTVEDMGYNNGDMKNQEEDDRMEMLNDRYESQLESLAGRTW